MSQTIHILDQVRHHLVGCGGWISSGAVSWDGTFPRFSKAVANSHSQGCLCLLSVAFGLLIVKQLQFILMDLSDTDCNGPSTCDPAAGSCQPHWAQMLLNFHRERRLPNPEALGSGARLNHPVGLVQTLELGSTMGQLNRVSGSEARVLTLKTLSPCF